MATHSISVIYGHQKGKVINLRREGDKVVAETIIEDNIPSEAYRTAIKDLGYRKNELMGAIAFYKEYCARHPRKPGEGGWELDDL